MKWNEVLQRIAPHCPWALQHFHFSSLPSTQDYVLEKPLEPNEIALVTADEQTHGRGRGERQWQLQRGNFAGTWIVPRPLELRSPLTTLGLAAAAALSESMRPWLHDEKNLQLKWPNDVLIRNKKVSGVLLGSSRTELRIGCGVNLVAFPIHLEEGMRQATSLQAESKTAFIPEDWMVRFAQRFFHLTHWLSGNETHWRKCWDLYGHFGEAATLRDGRVVTPVSLGGQGELIALQDGHPIQCTIEELV